MWFESPNNFDDEFDSALPISNTLSLLEIETILRVSTKINFETTLGRENSIKKTITAFKNGDIKQSEFLTGYLKFHSKNNIGITCFSKQKDIRILWALYADKGRGVCFKDVDFFRDIEVIKYEEELPTLKLDINNMSDYLKKNYTIKHSEWNTQKEIRLFRHYV